MTKGKSQQGTLLVGETGPLAGPGEVNRHEVRVYVQNVKSKNRVTLDIDTHLVDTDKAEANYHHEGYKAFQPIAASRAEIGLVLAGESGDGNVSASEDN